MFSITLSTDLWFILNLTLIAQHLPYQISKAFKELNDRIKYAPALDQVLHLIALDISEPFPQQSLQQLLSTEKPAPVADALQLDLRVAQLYGEHEQLGQRVHFSLRPAVVLAGEVKADEQVRREDEVADENLLWCLSRGRDRGCGQRWVIAIKKYKLS